MRRMQSWPACWKAHPRWWEGTPHSLANGAGEAPTLTRTQQRARSCTRTFLVLAARLVRLPAAERQLSQNAVEPECTCCQRHCRP